MASSKIHIELTVNQEQRELLVDHNQTLLEMLREDLGLTGAKHGCGEGECGACTVIMNGKPVNSCLVLAAQADGADILTIEGLADGAKLHPIQEAFIEAGAIQCGFCTPGMILSSKALLEVNPSPTRPEIRTALSGNLCRCTGYQKIVEAVEDAAGRMKGGGKMSDPKYNVLGSRKAPTGCAGQGDRPGRLRRRPQTARPALRSDSPFAPRPRQDM